MIIRNVRLIGELSDGIKSENGAVIIKDGIINEVIADGTDIDNKPEGIDSPFTNDGSGLDLSDQAIIDGRGMTLIPGLIDAHTHISGLRGYSAADTRKPMQYMINTAKFAQKYLQYGFTTIRDCGTAARVNNGVRDLFASGLAEGPRIISCGSILMPTETELTDPIYDMYQFVDSTDEARKATRTEIAEQADYIKVMASGSALDRHGIPDQPIMTKEELQTIVETAENKNTYVAAHAHGDGAIRTCIETGVHTIEHASFIGEETIDRLLETDGCWLIPTVSAMYQNPDTTPEEYQFLVKKLAEMLKLSAGCLRSAYERGAKIGFGTDSCPGMDQYEEGIEFRFRKEHLGMNDLDILLQATKNNAEALGISGEAGEIRRGLKADLVLVDGRPDEDIKVIYRRPEAVFLGGKRVR